MKTLKKIKLDKEKFLNNDELLSLRGGYWTSWPCLITADDGYQFWDVWNCLDCTPPQATEECTAHHSPNATCDCGCK